MILLLNCININNKAIKQTRLLIFTGENGRNIFLANLNKHKIYIRASELHLIIIKCEALF